MKLTSKILVFFTLSLLITMSFANCNHAGTGGTDLDENAPLLKLWQTGQTTSIVTGDDGYYEKGVSWPVPRFVDNGNGTITDNLTGLIWQKAPDTVMN